MDFSVHLWTGKDLKSFRERLGLTKVTMSEVLFCTTVRLWQIEKNDLELSDNFKKKIVKAFFSGDACNKESQNFQMLYQIDKKQKS